MKKYILLVTILLSALAFSHERMDTIAKYHFQKMMFFDDDDCDTCGCSASGGSMGFSSMLNQNFVGLRYIRQSYSTRDGIFNNSPWIDQTFNTVQAWGRIPVSKKIQITALVPYHFHENEKTTGTQSISGMGDITVMALYTVFETTRDTAVFKHTVQLGGGVKAPTGKYNKENNGSVNPSFQVGTGSWDYVLATEYIVRKDNLGLNAMLNYTIKTENADHYQFGNQFNYGSTLFYAFSTAKMSYVPQLGIAGEVTESNKEYGQNTLKTTSGDIFFGKIGMEIGRDRFSLGLNAMLPINQNLTGGLVKADYRWSVNLNYSL